MRVAIERLPATPPPPSVLAAQQSRSRAFPSPRPVARIDELAPPTERFDEDQRAELASVLERELAPLEPRVSVLDAVRSLARPGAAVVATAGAPGLLLSPLEHLVRGLHAVRVARSLTQAWERPVVPLFWLEECADPSPAVGATWFQNRHLDVQRVALAGLEAGGAPPALRPLAEEANTLAACRAALEQSLAAGAPFAALLDVLFPRAGETLTDAAARGLVELLGPFGLVVARAHWLEGVVARALARLVADDLPGRIAERRARLDPPPPAAPPALTLLEDGGPRPLEPGGEGWRHPDEPGSRNGAELAALLVQDPSRWAPGSTLTPLLAAEVLPSGAWIGSWNELERCLAIPWTHDACPPWIRAASVTLVDGAARASLRACGLEAAKLLEAGALPAEPPPAPGEADGGPAGALRRLADELRAELRALHGEVAGVDPRLVPLLRRAARDAGDALDGLAEKIERVDVNSRGGRARHRRRIESALFPLGKPQAELLGPAHLLARWGRGWLEPLLDALPAVPTGTLVAHVDDGAV